MGIGRVNTGGGGSGGTLVVTAPAGVTVTATKDDKTYTRTANAEGVATFKGLSSGTWMLSIDDDTHNPSTPVPVVVTADYAVTLKFFAATINVTYPAGSTLTCTDGVTTLTATTTTGSYSFTVPNAGTWTVKSTNGSQSASKAISITTDGQSTNVTLSYFTATINITYPAKSNCVVKNSSGVTVASNSNTGSSTKTWAATVTATGTYTVTATATDGSGNTKSGNVSITTSGQSKSVTLSYSLYLYNKGDLCSAVTGGWNSNKWSTTWYSQTGTMTKNADSITLSGYGAGAADGQVRQAVEAITQNKINLSGYSTLFIKVLSSPSSSTAADALLSVKDSYATSPSSSVKLQLAGAGTGLLSLDVSAITGSYYVSVSLGAGTGTQTITFDEVYLT